MIKGGIGGAKTKTGLVFESRIDLRSAFTRFKYYTAEKGKLFYKGKLVAEMFKKNNFIMHQRRRHSTRSFYRFRDNISSGKILWKKFNRNRP